MKMRAFDIIGVSGLIVVGLATGWIVRGGAAVVKPQVPMESISQSARKNEIRRPQTSNKWQKFATQFSTISEKEREAFRDSITPQDRSTAIETLLAQGGPSGFDPKLEEMINHLLSAWAEENFEAAWAWGQQLQGEGTQNFIISKLFDKLVKTDPERALTRYLEMMQTNPNLKSKVPEKILANSALKSADDFLKIARKLSVSFWEEGSNCEFAKDFNFQQVADEIGKLADSNDHQLPVGFPRNFHDAWAERDREAAFRSFTGGALERLGGFYRFLGGLEKHSPPEEVWNWVAGKIQESEISSQAIRKDLANLQPVSFNGIVQALPDAASRDHFLTQIALEGGVTFRRNEVPSIAISAMSSPQARLEAFAKMHQDRIQKNSGPLDIAKITDADLQAWEITRQAVEAIFFTPIKQLPESYE